jgi:hypothetical protein
MGVEFNLNAVYAPAALIPTAQPPATCFQTTSMLIAEHTLLCLLLLSLLQARMTCAYAATACWQGW